MLIFTGRFQPFHNGHLSIVENLTKKYPDEVICIAIIKDFPFLKKKDSFDKQVDIELSKSDDKLDAENTLYIINSIIKNRNYQNVVTTLMPRASLESWKTIESMFDCERVWVFTDNQQQTDLWEKTKIEFYKSRREKIILMPINKNINGTEIRKEIYNNDYNKLKNLVPHEVVDFYINFKKQELL